MAFRVYVSLCVVWNPQASSGVTASTSCSATGAACSSGLLTAMHEGALHFEVPEEYSAES